MSNKKIQDLSLKTPIDTMKIPTGGFGDYAVTIKAILDHFVDNHNVLQEDDLKEIKELLVSLEQRITTLENKVGEL